MKKKIFQANKNVGGKSPVEWPIYNYDDCNVPKWIKDLTNPKKIREIILTIKKEDPILFTNY